MRTKAPHFLPSMALNLPSSMSPAMDLCVFAAGAPPFLVPHRASVVASAFFKPPAGGRSCGKCGGKGSMECPGCKGTGKNKKNGNIFERWKCFDCQGFGLISCPNCGKGGLTPEQRGER